MRLAGTSPAWPEAFDARLAGSLALLLAGFIFVLALDRLAKRQAARVGEAV
jgi:uncharacterized membrane protein YjjP (DUF1212 family)